MEYGGYLPLEINTRNEYFDFPDKNIRRYNSGRTAMYALAASHQFNQVYIPYYICDTVYRAFAEQGISIKRYHIDEQFSIIGLERIPDDAAVLVVNYFGLMGDAVKKSIERFKTVILDQTQAFFSTPVMRDGVHNIYSCRKFVGVPDGAYIIAKDCCAVHLEKGKSWDSYAFLCKAHEEGTNAAYNEKLQNEERLAKERTEMSRLTQLMLKGISYTDIIERRKKNFTHMHNVLSNKNRLRLAVEGQVPYLYPLWVREGTGVQIRKALVDHQVYSPTLWKECLSSCRPTDLEYRWTNDIVFLPIDQRYGSDDIDAIIKILFECGV